MNCKNALYAGVFLALWTTAAAAAQEQAAPALLPDDFEGRVIADDPRGQEEERGFSLEEYKTVKPGLMMPATESSENKGEADTAAPAQSDAVEINIASGDQRRSFESILPLYQKGAYDEVLKALEPLIDIGHHGAEELLGVMYRMGQGVPKNAVRAFELLSRAAEANMPLAQHHLAIMYYTGDGVKADPVKALMWLHLAVVRYPAGAEKTRAQQDFDSISAQLSRRDRDSGYLQAREWLQARGEGNLLSPE